MVSIYSLPFVDLPSIFKRSDPEEQVKEDSFVFQASWPQDMRISTLEKILCVVYDIFSLLFLPLGIVRIIAYGFHKLGAQIVLPAAYSEVNLNTERELLLQSKNVSSIAMKTPDGITLDGVIIDPLFPIKDGVTLIDFLGNSAYYEQCGHYGQNLQGLRQIVRFNYRGVGKSEGAPTYEGLQLDGWTVVQYVHHHLGVPLDKIFIRGWSLGGFFGASAAVRNPGTRFLSDRSFSSLPKLSHAIISKLYGSCIGALAAGFSIISNWELNAAHLWDQIKSHKWIAYHPKDEIIPFEGSLAYVRPQDNLIVLKDDIFEIEPHCRPWNDAEMALLQTLISTPTF